MNLLPNQQSAITHLSDWRVGALFMEPGTGKTRVAIELANSIQDIDLIVWIAPLRTIRPKDGLPSVIDEVSKWGGFQAPVEYIGVESISQSDRIYLDVRSRIEHSLKPFIIVDESLKIKNANAKRTKRLLDLSKMVEYKLILNGTPLSKNLLDLWPQMEFLSPRILNMDITEFKNTFCEYTTITKRFGSYKEYTKEFITGYENIDYLYSLIRHYVFECDLNLSIRQNYSELRYNIDADSLSEYRRLKDKYLNDEMLLWKNNNIFLEMTQKMQHVYCCTEEKFKLLEGLFKEIDESRTIIYCKYISSREACEKRFAKATVLSYQKEAQGLNLQHLNNTIYFDKIWDYALRKHSTARTARTGQEYDCRYWDLTGNVGLETLIDKNIDKKIGMVEYFKGKTKEDISSDLDIIPILAENYTYMNKKFDLEKAKTGIDVVTKSGKQAKILLFDRDNSTFPLVVIIGNKNVYYYTIDGKFYKDKDSDNDLIMK
ncbi:DEAD/DEAH box helicase [Dysgonomonas macrotermitis]|uniref:SNF2 family N-terminal domain-containing protein n=1 Tax=Dysgonomonas macrotermitis TaxID=1346286 RepID=A0A1M5C3J0_9BACT|nr:DEAD/DEAH box helicase [Dysgonomonas macrotermitis]SHF49177.1 SNF2 family N-terminal domain-containing protein [Dysgonomonas macrotermitis]